MIYKAFLNRQEITGFPVNGIETTEIYGGDTLLWRKEKEEIELDQWWDVYELYARFKDPTPYKRAEVGFAIRTAHGYLKGRMAFGFCTRVVNGKYMVTAPQRETARLCFSAKPARFRNLPHETQSPSADCARPCRPTYS